MLSDALCYFLFLAFFFAAFFFFAIGWYLHQAYTKKWFNNNNYELTRGISQVFKEAESIIIIYYRPNNKNPSKKILIERFYRVN